MNETVILNPMTLSLGKVVGGFALIALVLYIFGAENIGTLLMYIAFPVILLITGVVLVTGGSVEMWSMRALVAGFKQGVADARAAKTEEPSFA